MPTAAPARPFRIIRGESARYRTHRYKTKESRDAAAERYAALDRDTVTTELWDATHPQDALNEGWACDGAAYPPGHTPKPDVDESRPHERTTADQVKVGDDVTVWAHEQGPAAPAGFRSGWVASIERDVLFYGSPALLLTMTDGVRFGAVATAVTYVWEPHEARQCGCPDSEQDAEGNYLHNCCNTCARPITDMGGWWMHVDDPENV